MGYSVVATGFAKNNNSFFRADESGRAFQEVNNFAGAAFLTTRWMQASSSSSLALKFSAASGAISKFRLVFFPAELINSASDFCKSTAAAFKLAFSGSKSRKSSGILNPVYASMVSSGFLTASKVLKGVGVVGSISQGRVSVGSRMEKKLSFASRYLGLLGSLIKVVTSLSAIKSLKKSAKDSSELKQVKVNQKLTHQYRGLVGRVISVASAILGFVAIAVGAAVIPWVIVALDTLSFSINFYSDVKKFFNSPKVLATQGV